MLPTTARNSRVPARSRRSSNGTMSPEAISTTCGCGGVRSVGATRAAQLDLPRLEPQPGLEALGQAAGAQHRVLGLELPLLAATVVAQEIVAAGVDAQADVTALEHRVLAGLGEHRHEPLRFLVHLVVAAEYAAWRPSPCWR